MPPCVLDIFLLEINAFGLLRSEKRKGGLKNRVTSQPSQRAHKAVALEVTLGQHADLISDISKLLL